MLDNRVSQYIMTKKKHKLFQLNFRLTLKKLRISVINLGDGRLNKNN